MDKNLSDLMEEQQKRIFLDHYLKNDYGFFHLYGGEIVVHPMPWWRRAHYRIRNAIAEWLHRLACRMGATCDWD